MEAPMKTLMGHSSPETAYCVADYPYGFRLRCSIRYWVETDPRHGQRLCTQTTNPKAGNGWTNKPKKGTYSPVVVMYLDEATGYVMHDTLSPYSDQETQDAFVARHGGMEGFSSDQRMILTTCTATRDAYERARRRRAGEVV